MRRFFALLCVLLALAVAVPALASPPGSPAAQTFNCSTVTEIPVTECQALMALYTSTNGPGWIDHTNWGTTTTPCSWYGLECASGGVITLGLGYNQLSGSIPPELGGLTGVERLDLSGNQLSGSIPPELGGLTSVEWLDLDGNQLSGSIPPELGSLSNLVTLYLFSNQLSGSIPSEIGNLTSLQYLYMYGNQLSGEIPAALANLTQLGALDLHYNRLTATDPALVSFLNATAPGWVNTQTLPPTQVQFGGSTLGWTPIAYTDDGGYYIISYATQPGGPYTVIGQTAAKTATSYTIPAGLVNASYDYVVQSYTPAHEYQQNNLTSSYSAPAEEITSVVCNTVTEIPVTECQALIALYISANGLGWANHTGWAMTTTPCSWYGVQCDEGHVSLLSLSSNQLSGNIPPELGSLTKLRYLYLTNNHLSGSIPPELGGLSLLIDLYLNSNQLSGSIPPQLGSLTNLWYLYLNGNQLSGDIPVALANMTGLQLNQTDLGYNRLTASAPSLLAFLAVVDPDWTATQTIPPANVRAVGASLTWTPIAYTGDGGYYVVSYATQSGGPYTVAGQTMNKTASGYTVAGLKYSTTYYFVVQSYTPAHGGQQNALTSGYSQEVSVTTSAANAIPQRGYYTTTTPTLTWNAISWAAGYEIQVATDKTFPTVVYSKNDLTAGDLSATINATPPLHKGTYYWRVRALRAGGSAGAWSAVDSFVVDVAP